MNRRGNALVITLLAIAAAALVGLCFAPLLRRPCGHRGSIANRCLSRWDKHVCYFASLSEDLHFIHYCVNEHRRLQGRVEDSLRLMVPMNRLSDIYENAKAYEIAYHPLPGGDWNVSVARTPSLPGWYLLSSDGNIHFSEKGPATVKDTVLMEEKEWRWFGGK